MITGTSITFKEFNDIIPAKAIGIKTVWVKNGLAQYQGAALGEGVSV